MKTVCKKGASLLLILTMVSLMCMTFTMGTAAAAKNLITTSTKIELLRPDKDIPDISKVWSWKNGVLTSLDKNREDANVVFKIDGLDNTKTYCYSGKLKILEFGSDTGWYGPRIMFRGKSREDISNSDYSALCHFQNTEVFINNFINASTLPYEVANVRTKLNKEVNFEIYVSPAETLVIYDGKQRFRVDNNARVQKLPLAFGMWTIGCTTQYYDLSLTEATMPPKADTSSSAASNTKSNPVSAGSSSKQSTAASFSTVSNTSNSTGDITSAESITEASTMNSEIASDASTIATASTQSEKGTVGDKPTKNKWLIPVIIVAIVVVAGAAVLFYIMALRKKKDDFQN